MNFTSSGKIYINIKKKRKMSHTCNICSSVIERDPNPVWTITWEGAWNAPNNMELFICKPFNWSIYILQTYWPRLSLLFKTDKNVSKWNFQVVCSCISSPEATWYTLLVGCEPHSSSFWLSMIWQLTSGMSMCGSASGDATQLHNTWMRIGILRVGKTEKYIFVSFFTC